MTPHNHSRRSFRTALGAAMLAAALPGSAQAAARSG